MTSLVTSPYWPFAVLLISMVSVIFMISKLKIHAFIALMLSAIIAGLLSNHIPVMESAHFLIRAVEVPMIEFGVTAGKIAWVIATASIIGTAMLESGAAERMVNVIISLLGEKRAPVALTSKVCANDGRLLVSMKRGSTAEVSSWKLPTGVTNAGR